MIDSQLGYRIGICVKATLGRGAWPVAPSATSLASTVLKRLSSGTLAVPASVDTSVPLMAAPVREDTTLRRVRSLSSTCGPTESLTRRSVGTSAKYCEREVRSSLSDSGRSTVWLVSVSKKVSCLSACESARLVLPRAAAPPSVPPLARNCAARSTSDFWTDTRSR